MRECVSECEDKCESEGVSECEGKCECASVNECVCMREFERM